jgi:hypothetical protein
LIRNGSGPLPAACGFGVDPCAFGRVHIGRAAGVVGVPPADRLELYPAVVQNVQRRFRCL